jgi:hypothetical protein
MADFKSSFNLLSDSFRVNVDNKNLVTKFKRIKERKKIPKKILDTALTAVNPFLGLGNNIHGLIHKVWTSR